MVLEKDYLSTNHALFNFTKFIYENINNNNNVLGVFIGIKKTFDSIDQNIMLKKLEYCGIRGLSSNLFKSYFQIETKW